MIIRAHAVGSGALLLGGLASLLGCGRVGAVDSPAPAPTDAASENGLVLAKSGARLAAQGYESQGALKFRYFEDEKLGMQCSFGRDPSGALRCFPQTEVLLVFLDQACTVPGAWSGYANPVLTEGEWVSDKVADACVGEFETHRTYRVGEVMTGYAYGTDGNIPGVYVLQEGQCVPTGPVSKGVPDVARLVPESPETFVGGRLAVTDVGSGLAVRQVIADDGASLNLDVATSDGTGCSMQASGACVPGPLAHSGGASLDPTCQTDGLYVVEDECAPPRFGLEKTGRIVELRAPERLFSRTVVTPTPADYRDWQYTCEETELFPNVFAPGRDVTDSLASADVVALGSGALRASALELGRGSSPFVLSDGVSAETFQTLHGTCRVTKTIEGVLRCIDDAPEAYEMSFYVDPTCSTRVYTSASSVVSVTDVRFLVRDERGLAREVLTMKPYEGPTYTFVELGRCGRQDVGGGETVLVPHEKLELATFPVVESVRLDGQP